MPSRADQRGTDAFAPRTPPTGARFTSASTAWLESFRQAVVRHRLAIALELGLVVIWFILRTTVDVRSGAYLVFTVIACAVAILSPTSGLVILVGTAPFFEPAPIFRELGMRHVLVAALGVSVVIRLVAGGWRQLPRSPALILGCLVAGITAVGVAHTVRDFDPAFGTHAAFVWLKSVGGAMILLIVGAWVARTGEARPLIAATVACVLASILSLIEVAQPGLISHGPLSWIGFWKDFGVRVSGIIPAPNAVATMLLIPATFALAAAGHYHGARRATALLVALPMVAASLLTLSRTAIGALYLAAVVFVARRRLGAGLIVLGTGAVLAVVAVPLFIEFRANRVGVFATQSPIEWLIGADQARLSAWTAAIRMWEASPIVGHGFLSYRTLADAFGDPRLGSPHNEVLRLFAEEGLVGGVAIIAFIAAMLRELARRPGWVGAGLVAGAIGYWAGAMFNNPFLYIQVSAMAFVFAGFGLTAPIREVLAQDGPDGDPAASSSVAGREFPQAETRP
jgi:O-antigen ligase